ncbi:MAG: hypothetical protein KJN90_07590 [Gammaproteobacteria bacterium]|nr:hypothetical protein [Gammaproteobacteria bacterium]
MSEKTTTSRLAGRLFAESGYLCMVVKADTAADTATVSSRGRLITMPLPSVKEKLSAYAYLALDNLNSDRTVHRLISNEAGWFFKTRETALAGPYDSREKAKEAMNQYIIRIQEGRIPEQR